MKTKKHYGNVIALLIASVIWGTAFVAQTTGGEALGPYGFNGVRNLLAPIVLLPVIAILDKLKLTGKKPETKAEKKLLWLGGFCCGVSLFLASNLQQVALNMGTATGKAGFLTTIYILLVPILGIFLKKKCNWNVWLGVAIALVGMYLLCAVETLTLSIPDVLLILCAFFFSVQILLIDYFAPLVDNVRLAAIQFLFCGLLTIIPAAIFDWHGSLEGFMDWLPALTTWDAWSALLFAAVLSSGVAYTLQIVGQNDLNPTIASMLMSLESVFSCLAGLIFLNQHLSTREIAGCCLIFSAVVLAQLPVGKNKHTY